MIARGVLRQHEIFASVLFSHFTPLPTLGGGAPLRAMARKVSRVSDRNDGIIDGFCDWGWVGFAHRVVPSTGWIDGASV
jgi:hypothetical protein